MLEPALQPALRPALRAALGSRFGAGVTPALAMLAPNPDGSLSVAPSRGISQPTFARSSTAYVQDWENVWRLASANEARFKGARRVENQLLYSQEFDNAAWVKTFGGVGSAPVVTPNYGAAPDGSLTADRVVFALNGGVTAADESSLQQAYVYLASNTYQSHVWLRTVDGSTKTINIRVQNGGVVLVTVDGTWRRFASSVLTSAGAGSTVRVHLRGGVTSDSADLLVWGAQQENLTAQSNQNPGEYIPTTTAAASKHFWRTNGNTVASNVVTEAQGVALHPTSTKDGVLCFDHYRSWAATTAYQVGQRITPTGGAYTGGGNGYWYECIVAGTSGASAPTWPTTGFGVTTVSSGGGTPTWRIGGYYRIAGYYTEGQRINSLLHSRDFSNAVWVTTGTGTATQNAVGFAGSPNMAWTLNDTDAAATYQKAQALTVPNDANTHVTSIFITKDAVTSRFPEFHVSLTGGTLVERAVQINTQTGAVATRLTAGTGTVYVKDKGDRWRLVISLTNNTSGNVTKNVIVRPAAGTTIGVLDVTATGSCVFDQAQVELNVGAVKIASSPIPTTTAAVTRAADTLDISKVGHFDPLKGCALAGFEPVLFSESVNGRILASDVGSDTMLFTQTVTASGAAMFNGVETTSGPTGVPTGAVRAGTRWGGTNGFTQQTSVHGANGTERSATDDLDVTTNLRIGLAASGSNFFGAIRNVRLYTADLGTARLNQLTDYDFDLAA